LAHPEGLHLCAPEVSELGGMIRWLKKRESGGCAVGGFGGKRERKRDRKRDENRR